MKKRIIEALEEKYPEHKFEFTETRINEQLVPVADLLIDGIDSKFQFSPEFLADLEYTATHDIGEPALGLLNPTPPTFDPKQELIEIAKECVRMYLENKKSYEVVMNPIINQFSSPEAEQELINIIKQELNNGKKKNN